MPTQGRTKPLKSTAAPAPAPGTVQILGGPVACEFCGGGPVLQASALVQQEMIERGPVLAVVIGYRCPAGHAWQVLHQQEPGAPAMRLLVGPDGRPLDPAGVLAAREKARAVGRLIVPGR